MRTNGSSFCANIEANLTTTQYATLGARFSAAWWSRMGRVLIRCHRFLFIQHGGWLYVDYFLFRLEATTAPLVATSWDVPPAGRSLSWDDRYDGSASTSTSMRVFGKFRRTRKKESWKSSLKYLAKETTLNAQTSNDSWAFRWVCRLHASPETVTFRILSGFGATHSILDLALTNSVRSNQPSVGLICARLTRGIQWIASRLAHHHSRL